MRDERIHVLDRLPADESGLADLKTLVRRRGLVLVPDVSLDETSFQRLVTGLGTSVEDPFLPGVAQGVTLLERGADRLADDVVYGGGWHQNLTFLTRPPDITVLYGSVIEDLRNYTAFVDLCEVDETLSVGFRALLQRERAVHSTASPSSPQQLFEVRTQDVRQETVHACHWIDDDTGRTWPYLTTGYVVRLDGWAPRESLPIVNAMYMQAARDEFVIRHYWAPGQLLLWDNRRYMHRATASHRTGNRRLLRADLDVGWGSGH